MIKILSPTATNQTSGFWGSNKWQKSMRNGAGIEPIKCNESLK